jgi:cation diffusion facilitator family transporter
VIIVDDVDEEAEVRAAASAEAAREKRGAALSSVVAAVFLTGMKLAIGLMTGSLGILSEAAHSALDLVAAGVTFLAVRVSDRPADREHTYGHGKVENLSALFETLLLLGTCVWIIHEAVQRLFFKHVEVQASLWAFIVMGVSIVVDVSRSRVLMKAARKHRSQALEADALHFSTDVWSSSVVIVGLTLVLVSDTLGLPWLTSADAVAAMAVAGIVVFISVQMGKRTVAALLDAVPGETRDRVVQAVRDVPGVRQVEQVRLRRSGPDAFADLIVKVGRDAALERAHEIASAAEAAAREVLPGADVVVHVEPVRVEEEDLTTSVRLLAARHGVGAHSIRTYDIPGELHSSRVGVELHLEVPDDLSVDAAHNRVTAFEDEVRRIRPEVHEVVTHIEPAWNHAVVEAHSASVDESTRVMEAVKDWLARDGGRCRAHQIQVQRVGDELVVSLHCEVSGDVPMTDAHIITEQVELALRERLPELGRVVIHIEPDTDARRAETGTA